MADPVVDRSDRKPPDLESLRRQVEGHPEDRGARLRLGWGLLAWQDYGSARDTFREARTVFPDDADVLYGLGLAAKHLGRVEEAEEAFSRVEGLTDTMEDPGRSEILKRLAMGHRNHARTGHWRLAQTIWGAG